MRARLPQREPEMLKRWQKQDIFASIRASSKGRPLYTLHDGPPYANGDIHIGHVVNKCLKDMVVKSRQLEGLDACYVPGWDCHGLPVEHRAEQIFGSGGDPAQFRAHCREYAQSQIERQRKDFKRLGIFGDWDHPYRTMDFHSEASILRCLGRVVAAGHLYRSAMPVLWSWGARSALAEAEVEYAERNSQAIDVAFPLDPANREEANKRLGIGQGLDWEAVIWTTTPWTLPSNRALSVHPDFNYVLVECSIAGQPRRLLLAASLAESALKRYGVTAAAKTLAQIRGAELAGLNLRHPFYDRASLIIAARHVTDAAGTGLVHSSPDHGLEDFWACHGQPGLEPMDPVDDDGRFRDHIEHFAGLQVFEADDAILALLSSRGALLHRQDYPHSYPHCWRTKTPLIYRCTPQWFISMDKKGLRQQALKEIERVSWVPAWGQERIRNMIAHRPDWCLSRQRTWGVPLALYYDEETNELHPNSPQLIEKIADLVEREGVEAWWNLDDKAFLGEDTRGCKRATDIVDVWFDSGNTWSFALVGQPGQNFPADLYLEGSDQHRGWFHSSLLSSVAVNGHAPYKQVLTHGFTVDEQGRKMSKSIGNVIAPQDIIGRFGADVLRLWVAATDYRGEMSISEEILARMADSYRKLRNSARFMLSNLYDFDPAKDSVDHQAMTRLDRWVLLRAARLQQRLRKCYTDHQLHVVCQELVNFCVSDLGTLYLDVIKDRLYTMPAASRGRRSAQTALLHLLEALARWMAPILSFTSEEIWLQLPNRQQPSVFNTTWHQWPEEIEALLGKDEGEPAEEAEWQLLLGARRALAPRLEALRQRGEIGSSLDAEIELYAPDRLLPILKDVEAELHYLLLVSGASVAPASERPEEAESAETGLNGEALYFVARPRQAEKCTRCWHRSGDVGADDEHPELCARCIQGHSERLFA